MFLSIKERKYTFTEKLFINKSGQNRNNQKSILYCKVYCLQITLTISLFG